MKTNKKRFLTPIIFLFLTTFILATATTLAQPRVSLTVSSAIALREPLEEIKTVYQSLQPNINLTNNFGSSGALQQQIENGAPVDIFISAAQQQMDALEKKGLLLTDTRHNLVKNSIVLIVPKASTGISSLRDLGNSQVKKIAIGEPRSVPIGRYSEEIFENLGITEQVQSKFVFGSNVRQVLSYVESGNVDAGIVWVTDAQTSERVKVVETVAENLHSPALFPVAVLKDSKNPNVARAYVKFLLSNEAKTIFTKHGFKMAAS